MEEVELDERKHDPPPIAEVPKRIVSSQNCMMILAVFSLMTSMFIALYYRIESDTAPLYRTLDLSDVGDYFQIQLANATIYADRRNETMFTISGDYGIIVNAMAHYECGYSCIWVIEREYARILPNMYQNIPIGVEDVNISSITGAFYESNYGFFDDIPIRLATSHPIDLRQLDVRSIVQRTVGHPLTTNELALVSSVALTWTTAIFNWVYPYGSTPDGQCGFASGVPVYSDVYLWFSHEDIQYPEIRAVLDLFLQLYQFRCKDLSYYIFELNPLHVCGMDLSCHTLWQVLRSLMMVHTCVMDLSSPEFVSIPYDIYPEGGVYKFRYVQLSTISDCRR